MSKNLILFLLISFCSFSGGINGKSIEGSLEEICDRISHCRSDEEEKKSSIRRILDNSLYEFNYKNENEEYKFFIPRGTIIEGSIIRENEKTYIKKDSLYLSPFPVWLRKKGNLFELDTYDLELLLDLDDVGDYKNKVLEFRKRLLDKNKNFIKEKENIEFEKKLWNKKFE